MYIKSICTMLAYTLWRIPQLVSKESNQGLNVIGYNTSKFWKLISFKDDH